MGRTIDQLEWERPDIRLLALAIDTYLMICYQMLVVVYVRRARLAKGTPKWPQMQGDAYEETRVYRRVLDQKVKWWTEKLEALKKWRTDQVSKIEMVEPMQLMIPDAPILPSSLKWSDSYTHHEDIVIGNSDGIEDRRNGYLGRLDTHVNKILSGDWGVMNCWKLRLEEIGKLLQLPKPGWVAISNVNTALKGAVRVIYRYDLSDDGRATQSERSDWTGELNLAEHEGKYPELLLSAENIPVDLTMTVYRRVARTLEGPFEDETEAAVTTKIGDRLWRDGDAA
ncbi:hypothetical protein FS837_005352 [Tulasnella sp. UAMH 9824]|nr:hypothetical protein FS837_005352 [Tulasnella sp. UAMH 9824]